MSVLTRRGLIAGLGASLAVVAAPAIVRPESIMRINPRLVPTLAKRLPCFREAIFRSIGSLVQKYDLEIGTSPEWDGILVRVDLHDPLYYPEASQPPGTFGWISVHEGYVIHDPALDAIASFSPTTGMPLWKPTKFIPDNEMTGLRSRVSRRDEDVEWRMIRERGES